MRTEYDKLVRDRIPEIIERAGATCAVERLDPAAYSAALRAKLVEEAIEASEAQPDELLNELADVHEVLDALLEDAGIDPAAVRARQRQRREERGGFAQRLLLRWTEEPEA